VLDPVILILPLLPDGPVRTGFPDKAVDEVVTLPPQLEFVRFQRSGHDIPVL
jgi:hypothetical protein